MGKKKTNKPNKIKQKYLFLAKMLFIIAAVELFYTGYQAHIYNQQIIHNQTQADATESIYSTELYFENPKSLPKKITLFKEETFRFTLKNKEKETKVYDCKVYFDTNGDKKILQRSKIKLDVNQSKTITVKYKILWPMSRSRVYVKLMPNYQNISYWIE